MARSPTPTWHRRLRVRIQHGCRMRAFQVQHIEDLVGGLPRNCPDCGGLRDGVRHGAKLS